MSGSYEWKALHRVKPNLPPYIVERVPYEECPNCGLSKYRPVYDGRTKECERECSNCKYTGDASSVPEPDRYVHDANKKEADLFLALILLAGFAGIVYLSLHVLGVV